MTTNPEDPFDGGIRTEDEFNTTLGDLLLAAQRNNVNPSGSWVVRTRGEVPDWEVQIFELDNGKES